MKKKVLIFCAIAIFLVIAFIKFASPSDKDKSYIKSIYLPTLCERINSTDSLSYQEEVIKFTIIKHYGNCNLFANSANIINGTTAELPDPNKFVLEYSISGFTYTIVLDKKEENNFNLLNVGAIEYEAPIYDKFGKANPR